MGVFSNFFGVKEYVDPNRKIREMEKSHTYSGVTNQWYNKKTGSIVSIKDFSKMSMSDVEKAGK